MLFCLFIYKVLNINIRVHLMRVFIYFILFIAVLSCIVSEAYLGDYVVYIFKR